MTGNEECRGHHVCANGSECTAEANGTTSCGDGQCSGNGCFLPVVVRVLKAHGFQVAETKDVHLIVTVTQGGSMDAILIDISSIKAEALAEALAEASEINREQVIIAIVTATTLTDRQELCRKHDITLLKTPFNTIAALLPLIPASVS